MTTNELDTEVFGLHLMFDGYNCDPDKLNSGDYVREKLNELTEYIGMTKLTEPQVVFTEGNNDRDPGGWSGIVMINESHISMHTFVKRKFVTADVYSCKEFDTQRAVDFLKKTFGTQDVETFIQKRGLRYPKENLI